MDMEKVNKELANLPTTIYCGLYQLIITHDLRDKVIALLKEQGETIDKLYSILNDVCKDVREETEGDHVCGLCEYDGAYITESGEWANECPGFESADCFCMKNEIRKLCGKELI